MNLEKLVKQARNKLSAIGIQVNPPTIIHIDRRYASDMAASYRADYDTLLVNPEIKNSKERAQADIEHELLHKWQYGSKVDMNHFDQLITMIDSEYDEATNFLSEAGFNFPRSLEFISDMKRIRLLLAYINLREDYPNFESAIKSRLEEITQESKKLHQKMINNNLDIDDPQDEEAQKLNQKLMELKEEKEKLKQEPRQARKEFIEAELENNREQIQSTLEIIKMRSEHVRSRKPVVKTKGEAMSYYWTFHRTGLLKKSGEKVMEEAESVLGKDYYDKKAIKQFRDIYNSFYKAIQNGEAYNEAFKKGWKKAEKKIIESE